MRSAALVHIGRVHAVSDQGGRMLHRLVHDGVETTIPLFRTLVRNTDVQNGDYDIHWLEKFLATGGMGEG